MVLSDIIVDLQAPGQMRHDIEVWNNGSDTLFVEVEAKFVGEVGAAVKALARPRARPSGCPLPREIGR